ncbi:MAG: FAD-dependent oxidoreductase [Saprospiraceae bacterium]|nr:FAD-dependent oxidoreductase [Saprospiraceae bacterium]
MPTERLYDVIVVGGGLTGLSAAHQLALAGKQVLVLESGSRVGGRIYSEKLEETIIEHGAQWIAPNHYMVIELANTLGLEIEKRPHSGQNIYIDKGGRKKFFTGLYPNARLGEWLNNRRIFKKLSQRVVTDPDKPWLSDFAEKLDRQRFSQFLRNKSYSTSYFRMISNIFESRHLNGINHVSSLEATTNWHLYQMQEKWTIRGGADQLSKKLAFEVNVQLGERVTQIVQNHVVLEISGGSQVFRAKNVIVTLPPLQAAQIRYEPPAGPSKESLWQSAEPGRIIKSTLIFERPYWRDKGWSGHTFLSDDYLMNYLVDAGCADHQKGVLTAYTIGSRCLKMENLNEQERINTLFLQIRSVLGLAADVALLSGTTHDWKTPPNGPGAYSTFPPGTLTTYGDYVDQNVGPIYWASAEYDHLFRSTMEGAVRSGRRAAEKILGI